MHIIIKYGLKAIRLGLSTPLLTLDSFEELLKITKSWPHPRPIATEFLWLGLSCQWFLGSPGWFQHAATTVKMAPWPPHRDQRCSCVTLSYGTLCTDVCLGQKATANNNKHGSVFLAAKLGDHLSFLKDRGSCAGESDSGIPGCAAYLYLQHVFNCLCS